MATPFKEILLNALSVSLEVIGETKLVEVLQKLHDADEFQYWEAIKGGRVIVNSLTPIVTKTGTKIDDALISALRDAIETSAEANAVETE